MLRIEHHFLLITLHRMQQKHQHNAQAEGNQGAVEGHIQVPGCLVEAVADLGYILAGQAAQREGARQASHRAQKANGGQRPGQIVNRGHT